jgi:type I restriction enzyme S subunit
MVNNVSQIEYINSSLILPDHWVTTSIREVCEVLDFQRIPVNASERTHRTSGKSEETLFPYYGATGKVDYIDSYIFDGEYILLGEDGAPFLDSLKNKAYIVNGKFWVNNHAHILKAKVAHKFLCHYLNQFDYSKYVIGTTRLKLNQASLLNIPVLLPPENEINEIINKIEELFSELDQGIENLKTAGEQIKIYRQSILKQAFEGKLTEKWRGTQTDQLETANQLILRIKQERQQRYEKKVDEWKKALAIWKVNGKQDTKPREPQKLTKLTPLTEQELANLPQLPNEWCWEQLATVSVEITDGDHQAPPKAESGVPFIVISNIKNNQIDFRETKYVPRSYYNAIQDNRKPVKGDILYTVTASFGIPCLIDFEREFCFQRHIALIRLENMILEKFIFYFLQSNLAFKQALNVATGTAQKTVSLSGLRMFKIPIAPFNEQIKIVDEIEKYFSVINLFEITIQSSLAKAEILRQSILKKAFSGHLVPPDPNDEPASILLERIRTERETTPKPIRKTLKNKNRKDIATMPNLISVIESAENWLSAKDVFRQCGISDGAETKDIEKLYLELRDLINEEIIKIERRGDEDWLCICSIKEE